MSSNEYHLRKKKEYDAQKKALLSLIKILQGCEQCGYNQHPQALTFDHIDPSTKEFSVANYGARSWEALLKEIDKCRVLCANCHNIHTAFQQANGVEPTPITSNVANLINQYQCDLLKTNLIPAWTSFTAITLQESPSIALQCA